MALLLAGPGRGGVLGLASPGGDPGRALAPEVPRVSVRIVAGAASVTLGSTSGMSLRGPGGGRLETLFGGMTWTVTGHLAGVVCPDGTRLATLTAKPRTDGHLKADHRGYRGDLRIVPDGKGGLDVIDDVDMESYLDGVVQAEMVASAPPPALETQAIIARTFALRRLQARPPGNGTTRAAPAHHLESDERSQVYRGVSGEDPRTTRAVRRTRGLVLTRDGELLETLYHASCGGMTENNDEVWRSPPAAHLRARPCAPCQSDPPEPWSLELPYGTIRERLAAGGTDLGALRSVAFTRTRTGRLRSVLLSGSAGAREIPANEFRLLLDARTFKSLAVTEDPSSTAPDGEPAVAAGDERAIGSVIRAYLTDLSQRRGRSLTLTGRGSGHGVGLCQRGAEILARSGWPVRAILGAYYGEAEVDRRY